MPGIIRAGRPLQLGAQSGQPVGQRLELPGQGVGRGCPRALGLLELDVELANAPSPDQLAEDVEAVAVAVGLDELPDEVLLQIDAPRQRAAHRLGGFGGVQSVRPDSAEQLHLCGDAAARAASVIDGQARLLLVRKL